MSYVFGKKQHAFREETTHNPGGVRGLPEWRVLCPTGPGDVPGRSAKFQAVSPQWEGSVARSPNFSEQSWAGKLGRKVGQEVKVGQLWSRAAEHIFKALGWLFENQRPWRPAVLAPLARDSSGHLEGYWMCQRLTTQAGA